MTTPSPECARLAAALREVKERTGLSMAGLASKTPFSKSSWERYLNGKTLPPREAVRELCRLAGAPDGRCLALWEIAESEWRGRGTGEPRTEGRSQEPKPSPTAAPPPPPAPRPPPQEVTRAGHKGLAAVAVLASVSAVAVGGVAVALFLLPDQDVGSRSSASPSATGPRCRGAACEGKSPMHMKCGVGPDTLASHRTATGAWLELRHSEACGTSWARMWGTRIGDRIEMTVSGRDGLGDGGGLGDGDGRVRSAEVEDDVDAEAYVYTLMAVTRPGAVVEACFQPAAGGRRECFDGSVDQSGRPPPLSVAPPKVTGMATLPNPLPRLATLGLPLPPGRLVDETPDGPWHEPLLWYADRPASLGDWSALAAPAARAGLLPVLVDTEGVHGGGPESWALRPELMSYPGDHDAEEVLAEFWEEHQEVYEAEYEEGAPGPDWPGLASAGSPDAGPPDAGPPDADPDVRAAEVADLVCDGGADAFHHPSLALVPARRSADIPAAIGWTGPLNHENDVARLCAVLRSWEDRFGIRVVALTPSDLLVSVAAPPTTPAEAEAVAAEHLAFCPDAIWQTGPGDLVSYAKDLIGQRRWSFWWD